MKIGINCGAYGRLSIEEQIALMKEYGFSATFAGSEDADLDHIVKLLHKAGIEMVNCHAPFNGINSMWLPGEAGEVMLGRLISGVQACAKNEIKTIVVHLSSGDAAPLVNDLGFSRFDRLMEEAERCGVTIAYENQRKLANLAVMLERHPKSGFCWDVGHEACFAYGREYMPLFGDRLVALHLHDNFGVHNEDRHMIPYDAGIDMDKAARAIAASPYQGPIMLELIRNHSDRYNEMTPAEYYRHASEAASKFEAMVKVVRT